MSPPLAFTVAPGTTGTTRPTAKLICLHLHSKRVAWTALLTKVTWKAAGLDIQSAYTVGVQSKTTAMG
jgi:hypothetical protein